MIEQAASRPARSGGLIAACLAGLRFLFTDRLGLVFLAWGLIALVLRPMVMGAHEGLAGPAAEWLRANLEPLGLARLAGSAQLASLAGLVLGLMLIHVRIANTAPELVASARARFVIGALYALAFCLGYALFVWTPATAVSLMLHDAFIFFDAIYRIDAGQVPSADFPTPLGAAMLYLPWLGSKIAGGYAGAIEISSAIVAFALCLVCAYAGARRHPAAVTAVLVAAIFLITVPAMLEGYLAPDSATLEGGKLLNINEEFALAMFYNRWGWGALIAMFAFLTPRGEEKAPMGEIAALGLMLVFLFWLKLSYFLVGGAAAVLYAFLGPRPSRTLCLGAGICIAGILGIGLITGNLIAYVLDIITTARVSGARVSTLTILIKDNLLDFLIACSPVLAMGLMRRLKAIDIWVTGLIVLGTLFIINQNAQMSGVPTMLVVAAYAIWRLKQEDSRALRLIAAIGLAIPAASFILERGSGLLGQTIVARREEARPPAAWAGIPAMQGVYAQEHESLLDRIAQAETLEQKLSAFRAISIYGRRQFLRSGEYMASLIEAMGELKPVMGAGESVVAMDFSSPLAFLTKSRPARGYWLTFDDGRTISKDVAPKASLLFADADHVLAPKIFMEPDTASVLRALYAEYLDEAYEIRVETAYWTRWSGRREVAKSTPLARSASRLQP